MTCVDPLLIFFFLDLSLSLSFSRKHEQEQHDKEISDLVHGIAAGNLWKRRNGQADDMDIFDEDDINGRFRRKKKLKVSEKFEKLGMRPFLLCSPAGSLGMLEV